MWKGFVFRSLFNKIFKISLFVEVRNEINNKYFYGDDFQFCRYENFLELEKLLISRRVKEYSVLIDSFLFSFFFLIDDDLKEMSRAEIIFL